MSTSNSNGKSFSLPGAVASKPQYADYAESATDDEIFAGHVVHIDHANLFRLYKRYSPGEIVKHVERHHPAGTGPSVNVISNRIARYKKKLATERGVTYEHLSAELAAARQRSGLNVNGKRSAQSLPVTSTAADEGEDEEDPGAASSTIPRKKKAPPAKHLKIAPAASQVDENDSEEDAPTASSIMSPKKKPSSAKRRKTASVVSRLDDNDEVATAPAGGKIAGMGKGVKKVVGATDPKEPYGGSEIVLPAQSYAKMGLEGTALLSAEQEASTLSPRSRQRRFGSVMVKEGKDDPFVDDEEETNDAAESENEEQEEEEEEETDEVFEAEEESKVLQWTAINKQ